MSLPTPFIFRQITRTFLVGAGTVVLLLLGLAVGSAAESAHAAPSGQKKPDAVGSGVNSVLIGDREGLSSSNLTTHPHGRPPGEVTLEEYSMRLSAAQQMHLRKNLDGAKKAFVSLVKSPASDEIKKTALLALALIAQERDQLARAQQIYSQYRARYPRDPSVPEILLRQGLLYREMGSSNLALSKFYSVLGSALALKEGDLPYHQRLVLQAQTEIADTYYHQGDYKEAAEYLRRLLKLNSPDLNRRFIRYKVIRCLSALGDHRGVIADAKNFVALYPGSTELAEVRSRYAQSLKALGYNQQALNQMGMLLRDQDAKATADPDGWVYWQKRIGNEIANLMYQEEDFVRALDLYLKLAKLDDTPQWQLPVFYQIGLCYERLKQPEKAGEYYVRVAEVAEKFSPDEETDLSTMVEMAAFRAGLLQWRGNFENQVKSTEILNRPTP